MLFSISCHDVAGILNIVDRFPACLFKRVIFPMDQKFPSAFFLGMLQDFMDLPFLFIVNNVRPWSCRCSFPQVDRGGPVRVKAVDVEDIMDLHGWWELKLKGDWRPLFQDGVGSNELGLKFAHRSVLVSDSGGVVSRKKNLVTN